MDLTIRRAAALMLLMAGLLMSPTDLSSCGPFLMRALFSVYRAPEKADNRYLKGRLGVLQPNFPRFYLYFAYRYLNAVPLSAEEQKALFTPPPAVPADRWSSEWNTSVPHIVDEWLDARKKAAPDAGDPPKIAIERTVSTSTDYYQYTNCLDDAFRSAIATLRSRTSKFGVASPTVKDWVKGQDTAFANCSGEPPAKIPAAAPPDSDPLLKADRAYQIAAANLYAGQLDEAEAHFAQIASETTSPWREMAAYLVARTQIRKATIKNDSASMAKAEAQLQTVLADNSLASIHPAAKRLAEFVRSRLHPQERFTELARLLVKPDASLDQDLTDYRFLYDKFEDGKFGDAVHVPLTDDLSDWLSTFHNHGDAHAVETWHSTKSLPWLLATLQDLHAGNSAAAEAIGAADKLKPDSPAYLTAAFHANRLIIEAHRDAEARGRLDALLDHRAQIPPSAVNLFLAERMKVAVNWDEFLRYAQRVPVGINWDEGAEVDPDALKNSPLKAYSNGRTALDADGARILNQQTPLRLIQSAATGTALPAALRGDLALAAWTRAVLIDDEKTAADLAPVLGTLDPSLKDSLAEYSAAPDQDRKRFAAAYLMLKNPGIRPYVETGFGRLTALEKIDDFRDNWWCSFNQEDPQYNYYKDKSEIEGPLKQLYQNEQPTASFLSPPDRAQAEQEWKKLAALPPAPNYLASQVIAFTQAHADDPRAAEALHLAVRATRYGCSDPKTGALSKQAFDLLHQRYPNSEWAKQTKFWYK